MQPVHSNRPNVSLQIENGAYGTQIVCTIHTTTVEFRSRSQKPHAHSHTHDVGNDDGYCNFRLRNCFINKSRMEKCRRKWPDGSISLYLSYIYRVLLFFFSVFLLSLLLALSSVSSKLLGSNGSIFRTKLFSFCVYRST